MTIIISDAGMDWRGTEMVTLNLMQGLRSRGHRVVVFCRPNSILEQRLTKDDSESILSGSDVNVVTHLRCARALRRHKADLILTQKDKDVRLTAVPARLLGIPVLVRHTVDRPLKGRWRDRLYYGAVASHHVANTQSTLRTLRASAPWLADRNIPVIYNGIDVKRFEHATPLDLGLPDDAIAVGFVGQLEMRKGIIDFAHAWRLIADEVPHAHAVIAGRGPRERAFREALSDAPRVHWLGFREDTPELLRALDIFVLPSHFEGFGLVLAEAMAAGAACVAYEFSNIPELMQDEKEGLLVPLGNVPALADGVIRLCSDQALRARLAASAAARARSDFAVDRMVREYEALCTSIIAEGSHDRP
jgi:glycosyltransferase involved in cell wall biosynthesis